MSGRLATVAGAVLALFATAAPGAAPGSILDFRVELDGRPIGEHRFELRGEGDAQEVISRAEFSVRLLFVELYRYRHTATEYWRNGCLESLESRTDDNGRLEVVTASRRDRGLDVVANGSEGWLGGCVRSFAYWNPRILESSHLLNSQTGEYIPVRVDALGEERITVAGDTEPARRYRIVGKDIEIDLWYGRDQEWLALESHLQDGRRLRYERS